MNIKESIRRIIREEIEIPKYLRRRLHIADDYFDLDYFGVQEICMKWIEQTYGLKTNYIYSSYNGQEENIL